MSDALLPKVKLRVSLALRNRVSALMDGSHASSLLGRSHEFHDLREYQLGDNVRDIDWRATARSGHVLVKQFTAERRATLLTVVATGRDLLGMASPTTTKAKVAVEIAATLAAIALNDGDQVGHAWYRDGLRATRPRQRAVEVEAALSSIREACRQDAAPANLLELLDFSIAALRHRAVVALVLDDVDITTEIENRLKRLAAQHDLWVFTVLDAAPREISAAIHGLDDGRGIPRGLQLSDRIHREWLEDRDRRSARRQALLRRIGVKTLEFSGSDDVVVTLVQAMRRWRRG